MADRKGQPGKGGEQQPSNKNIQDTVIKLIDEKSDKLEPWLVIGGLAWVVSKIVTYQGFKDWCRRNVPTYTQFAGVLIKHARHPHGPVAHFFRTHIVPRTTAFRQRRAQELVEQNQRLERNRRRSPLVRVFMPRRSQ